MFTKPKPPKPKPPKPKPLYLVSCEKDNWVISSFLEGCEDTKLIFQTSSLDPAPNLHAPWLIKTKDKFEPVPGIWLSKSKPTRESSSQFNLIISISVLATFLCLMLIVVVVFVLKKKREATEEPTVDDNMYYGSEEEDYVSGDTCVIDTNDYYD